MCSIKKIYYFVGAQSLNSLFLTQVSGHDSGKNDCADQLHSAIQSQVNIGRVQSQVKSVCVPTRVKLIRAPDRAPDSSQVLQKCDSSPSQ